MQMALNEQVRVVGHFLVDGGVLSWVVQGPVSRCSTRKAAIETVVLEEGDQVASVFDESG